MEDDRSVRTQKQLMQIHVREFLHVVDVPSKRGPGHLAQTALILS